MCFFLLQNLKVHENRRQLFSANASKDKNPFVRQRPVANLSSASSSTAPPWANGSMSLPLSDIRSDAIIDIGFLYFEYYHEVLFKF